MTDRDQDLDRPSLDAYEVPDPPADLPDRVIAALRAGDAAASGESERPARRTSLLIAGSVLAAAAVAATLVFATMFATSEGEPTAGARSPTERQAIQLGARGVAVAEAGAMLSWQIAPDGAVRVNQVAGDVFYRVEPGERFVVATPAGDVTVQGTCFGVEVRPMKKMSRQSVAGAAVGAALSAAIVVTVYEGQVLMANEHGEEVVSAGERGMARSDSSPSLLSGSDPAAVALVAQAPAEGVTREDLLERDRYQREELAQLRDRLRKAEGQLASAAVAPRERGVETFVDPSREELLELAKECRIAFDTPTISLDTPHISDDVAAALSPDQRQAMTRVYADFNTHVLEELRALYIEVTGDVAGADDLSPSALREEISSKTPEGEAQVVFQRLSRERAGLAQPPADGRGASITERYYRLMTSLGDRFEQELGGVVGQARAHELRKRNDGWGNKHGMSRGCPQ